MSEKKSELPSLRKKPLDFLSPEEARQAVKPVAALDASEAAQALLYRSRVLGERAAEGCIAVAHGGEASTATSGFWAALNIATTQRLPVLFFIEDNGYGISVRSELQTPGANVAANLASFVNLRVLDGDGSDPVAAPDLIAQATSQVRAGGGPVLLRLTVPRLSGHSGQDTQAYKSPAELAAEAARHPLARLGRHLVPGRLAESEWRAIEERAQQDVEAARAAVEARPFTDPRRVRRYAFSERNEDGSPDVQLQGIRPLVPGRPRVCRGSHRYGPFGRHSRRAFVTARHLGRAKHRQPSEKAKLQAARREHADGSSKLRAFGDERSSRRSLRGFGASRVAQSVINTRATLFS